MAELTEVQNYKEYMYMNSILSKFYKYYVYNPVVENSLLCAI